MKTKLVEIKARYEVAQFAVSTGPVEYTIIESLADIPYLLGELKRVTGAVETSTEKAISDKASEKQYREALWREVDTGLHLSRYSDANAETSDDMKAVRARYEAAVGCKNSDNLTETGKKIFAALADIPRLQQEVERLKNEASTLRTQLAEKESAHEQLKEALPSNWPELNDRRCDLIDAECDETITEDGRRELKRLNAIIDDALDRAYLESHIASLNKHNASLTEIIQTQARQLADRDAEIGRLEGILQSAMETFTATQLGKESQIESLSTENERLRECLQQAWDLRLTSYTGGEGYIFCTLCGGWSSSTERDPAEGPDSITHNDGCLFQVIGDLRRRGEAMEGKGDENSC